MKYFFVSFVCFCIQANAQQSKPVGIAAVEFRQPDSLHATQFYTEIVVNSATHGFYGLMFSKGMLLLEKKKNNLGLVFKLKDEVVQDAKLLSSGLKVDTGKTGEATFKYDWQPGRPYKLLVTALADSATQTTQYAGYVFLDKEQQWKYLAAWQISNDGKGLQQPALILMTQKNQRKIGAQKLTLQQAWLQRNNGSWKPLNEGVYVANMKGGMGTDSGHLFIAGQPFIMTEASSGSSISTVTGSSISTILVSNNIDSLAQSTIDKLQIIQAIQKAGADTSLSANSVYYTMLKEGTGNPVNVTDTVTVFIPDRY